MHWAFSPQFATIALDGIVGLMLVIVSHSLTFAILMQLLPSPALYMLTGPSNTVSKPTHQSRYAHLPPPCSASTYQSSNKLISGLVYFPLMFLLNTGAAIVSSVGFVSIVSQFLEQFEWLIIYLFFTVHSADTMPWPSLLSSQSQT